MKAENYTNFSPEGTLKVIHKLEFHWVEESKEGDAIKGEQPRGEPQICM